MDLEPVFKQIVLGMVSLGANFLSASAGGGAGLVQLPALVLLGLPFSSALATHKLASVALGLGAGLRHAQERTLKSSLACCVLVFGLPGVWLGAQIALVIPPDIGTFFLGALTFCIGIYSIKSPNMGIKIQEHKRKNLDWIIGGVGLFLIGLLNGSFSSGTGLLVTIWLVKWFKLAYLQAIAYTLILVGLMWNGTGALVLGLNGQVEWTWLPMLLIGSFIGGYLGAQLSLSKGSSYVKYLFEILSLAMGLSLLVRKFV